MTRMEARKLACRLRRRGFDRTRCGREDGECYSVRPRCGQCQALVVNGVACHERGCPNGR